MKILSRPQPKLPKVIAVLAPTASGKTDLALKIARRFRGEIIVADSRQVYKKLDIGTNKVQGKFKKYHNQKTFFVENIPYHGTDLIQPNGSFTAEQWKSFALKKVEEIIKRKHLPIIEGGTYLYVSALLDNLTIPKIPPNPKLRAKLEKKLKTKGLESLVEEILAKDPLALKFLDAKNPRRVIRALEVIEMSGKTFSEMRNKDPKLFDDLRIGIKMPVEKLEKRITNRVQKLIDKGLEREARALHLKYGYKPYAMSGIGYIEWKDYFNNKVPREKAILDIVTHTKQYARGQLKWLKRDKEIHWVNSARQAIKIADKFLK